MKLLVITFLALLTLMWMGLASGLIQYERSDRVKYDRTDAWRVED